MNEKLEDMYVEYICMLIKAREMESEILNTHIDHDNCLFINEKRAAEIAKLEEDLKELDSDIEFTAGLIRVMGGRL